MKKTLLMLLLPFMFSCTKEDDTTANGSQNKVLMKNSNEIQKSALSCSQIDELSEGFLNTSTCTLTHNDPFVNPLNTFSIGGSPSYKNFTEELAPHIFYGVNGLVRDQMQRPSTRTLVSSSSDYINLAQIINTSDIYPQITSTKANTVYSHVACKYKNQIASLSASSPLTNGGYFLEIDYIMTDFSMCGGPSSAVLMINYSIYIYTF